MKLSLASPRYEMWPRILCLWIQYFLWHSTFWFSAVTLAIVSITGNWFQSCHSLPLSWVVLGPYIVLLDLIHPEYQPSSMIFRSPDPYWYLSASTLKMGQPFVCTHFSSCQIVADSVFFHFHTHKWCQQFVANMCWNWKKGVVCRLKFCKVIHVTKIFRNAKR